MNITVKSVRVKILVAIASSSIIGALLLTAFPATAFYNKLLGKPALHGFQSSIQLYNYPMLNQLGEEVTWQSYADQPLYITTGFTVCSFTCPVSMQFYQKIQQNLNDKAAFSLLTIDPLNDSPQVLARFLKQFSDNFIGFQISDVAVFNKVITELNQSVSNIPGKKEITHSNYIYLLHPKLNGLVVYTKQNLNHIVNDYKLLMDL